MAVSFFSSDFGALAFGREVLKKSPAADIEMHVQAAGEKPSGALVENDFWKDSLAEVLKNKKVKNGPVGIFFDRKNVAAREFFSHGDAKIVRLFETSVVHEIANEGLADTVEFRRFWRRIFRYAKNVHVSVAFFPAAIFSEEKTKNILQHLAGTQMKCFFVTDFLSEELSKKSAASKQKIQILTGDDLEFSHARAEQILKSKLKKTDVKKRG